MSQVHVQLDQRELAVPLDSLLANASRLGVPDVLPGAALLRWAAALARRPRTTGGRLADLAAELTRVIAGTSTISASSRDRRFSDPAWTDNGLLRRTVQAYLAAAEKALQLVDDAELEERAQKRVRLFVENLVDALAPSNNMLLNPVALKEVVNTGGANLGRGLRNLLHDLSSRPRVPSMVDSSQFAVGTNIGATKGSVVLRTPVLELIQYAPITEQVREVPLLMVPPTINKYYVLDLAPGRSYVEFLLGQGQQVFMISWRNPTARHADWNLDTYIHGALEAMDAAREIAGIERVGLHGTCSGGIVASMAAAHLAGTGRGGELASLTLAVTVLDQAGAGTAQALVDHKRAAAAAALSKRVGYLDGAVLAEVFAWLRPNDLIWNYWVNNYLLGQKPPAFDILFWNSDTTRMPAQLHRDFLELSLANKLVTAGDATALGVPVDLSKITADAFIVGGRTDHITPWQNCYRSTALLGGKTEFVLSTSGHIAALVNPPTNAKASFQTSAHQPTSPAEFVASAETRPGSWWPHYAQWLAARSGKMGPAPPTLGTPRFRPLIDAPGSYVLDT
ncbi:PHA/PHB synthase family protein [Nocardioides pocheonensis]|uniref:Alpha/beta fold hydrolase n=1 Tax=Nocardioides pocheonensis TaxID=661485 RepID=A0A3N0GKD2_9ACTN|nr:alpha/beta fold hydrolase [Nocardioides pocheonensis]RNM12632.1 alpha/beta fold hydrolase [Nocardioides pocheonensis]